MDRRRFSRWRARRRTAFGAHGAAPSFDDRGATTALAGSARTARAARFAANFQPESARAIPAVERGSAARTRNDATGVLLAGGYDGPAGMASSRRFCAGTGVTLVA